MATDLEAYLFYDAGAGSSVTEGGSAGFTRGWRDAFSNGFKSGVVALALNEFATTGDSTGMQVKTATGRCWVAGNYGENQNVKVTPIAASHATLSRIDLVVVRNDFSANKMVVDVLTGTPATTGTQVAPTPTQNTSMYELPLAKVAIAPTVTTITAGNVTDARSFMTERSPSCKAVLSTQPSVANSDGTSNEIAVIFDAADAWDTDAMHSPTGGLPTRVLAPVAGRYMVRAYSEWTHDGNNARQSRIFKNGSLLTPAIALTMPGIGSINRTSLLVEGTVDLVASDYVELRVLQTSGGALTLLAAWLELTYAGPSVNRP